MTMTLPDYDELVREGSISILEARRAPEEELYILNTSDLRGRHQKGELKLKVTVEGRRVRVNVPDTWIPWELSRYTTKRVWLNDPDFVKLVDRRVVTLLKSSFAKEIVALPEAEAENEQLHKREQELEFGFHQTLEDNEKMLEGQEDRDKVREADERLREKKDLQIAKQQGEGYKPSIKLVTVLSNKNLDEVSKVNALMNMRSELKLADINYIMTKLGKNETKIKEWAITIKNNLSK